MPACAGNTITRYDWRYTATVHPRVRGEYKGEIGPDDIPGGSSPRARGIPHVTLAQLRKGRFIPACAGNTALRCARIAQLSVHPRVRGEYGQARCRPALAPGSSPRARGIRWQRAARLGGCRFIPACAGNTRAPAFLVAGLPVHPRVRGEYHVNSKHGRPYAGSSPRARGIRRRVHLAEEIARFIPACAGNTTGRSKSDGTATVHPRVRGEYQVSRPVPSWHDGSSPRARGIRL